MKDCDKFYIAGQWVDPAGDGRFEAVNPASEQVTGAVAMGGEADVDRAVEAARQALPRYAALAVEERKRLLQRVAEEFKRRTPDLVEALRQEIGCPTWLAEAIQVPAAVAHIEGAVSLLSEYRFEETRGTTVLRKEPIGVCALITPWNWPLATVMSKVVPALATGCTLVLKPSEFAPYSARIVAEVMDAAGVPPGVFNMLYGEGPVVGAALSRHPHVDMVSITGSTRAGIEVARNAASTIKRVHQELGGKSPNIVLDDADLEAAVTSGIKWLMMNSGQTCSAPTRLLVPRSRHDEAVEIARRVVDELTVGTPDSGAYMGPVVNRSQWDRIQSYIRRGMDEGATLVVGGSGRPAGLERGFYVQPTVFAGVTTRMAIGCEEIFGPVLVIQAYDDEADAVRIANDTPYGLAAYIHGKDPVRLRRVADQVRAGQVFLNGDIAISDGMAPFGGYKQSGNGREWGEFGFEAFTEVKALLNCVQ